MWSGGSQPGGPDPTKGREMIIGAENKETINSAAQIRFFFILFSNVWFPLGKHRTTLLLRFGHIYTTMLATFRSICPLNYLIKPQIEAIKFYADIHGVQRIKPSCFHDPVTFLLASL